MENSKEIIENMNQDYNKLCRKFGIISNLIIMTLFLGVSILWIGIMFDMRIYALFTILTVLSFMVSTDIFKTCVLKKYSKILDYMSLNEEDSNLCSVSYIEEFDTLNDINTIVILVFFSILSVAAIGYGIREQALLF